MQRQQRLHDIAIEKVEKREPSRGGEGLCRRIIGA
jgi:hypothetical protein